MNLSAFQSYVRDLVQCNGSELGKSVLVVAPTGLGKTLAATADLKEMLSGAKGAKVADTRIIYSVPLRALAKSIQCDICESNGLDEKDVVIHHGDEQGSQLFSERVVITTFDQIVCGTPGLPLSFSLKAGHAVAGALLMSRLILDEVHLAWSISRDSLSILLGIIAFRRKFGLQTVVLTATLPAAVCKVLSESRPNGLPLFDEIVIAGDQCADDERLQLRNQNRQVIVRFWSPKRKKSDQNLFDVSQLANKLVECPTKVIYFSNTVDRLQELYDELCKAGVPTEQIIVLHNRMPKNLRDTAEQEALSAFGRKGGDKKKILLTNQVSEAGLDISAPEVYTDPAPVETLVQRAGRCARWIHETEISKGEFVIIKSTKEVNNYLSSFYDEGYVEAALKVCKENSILSWDVEREWVDTAWGGDPKKAANAVEQALDKSALALNMFDRAAQNRSPGEIAKVFREILSIEVGVVSTNKAAKKMIEEGQLPHTSSISLAQGRRQWGLYRGQAGILRNRDGHPELVKGNVTLQLGDILLLTQEVATVHCQKGLCFSKQAESDKGQALDDGELWFTPDRSARIEWGAGNPQTLSSHTSGVMGGVREKLSSESSPYRRALRRIVAKLMAMADNSSEVTAALNAIVELAVLGAGLHDIGKGDRTWQKYAWDVVNTGKVTAFQSGEIIGRTGTTVRFEYPRPHTPPAYSAIVKAAELLLGDLCTIRSLVRAIALASARHHSALLNPALISESYGFTPVEQLTGFVEEILEQLQAPKEFASDILKAACIPPKLSEVPLMSPNDDLFPVYALVGRAILMADREDASGKRLEVC